MSRRTIQLSSFASGQTLLVDTGWQERATLTASQGLAKQAGITQIDIWCSRISPLTTPAVSSNLQPGFPIRNFVGSRTDLRQTANVPQYYAA